MRTPLLRHARKSLTARATAGLALSGALVVGAALPASAETTTSSTSTSVSASASASAGVGDAVIATAAQLIGTPYRYGGTTPAGFDCSGYTGYVLGQHGVALPRTADAQMRSSRHVSAAEAAPGDLVFVVNGGRATHAGIYAGGGQMYDSPSRGGAVSKRALWTSSVVYGRVLG